MKARHEKSPQRGTELLWHKERKKCFLSRREQNYFLSWMSECPNQDHRSYKLVFNISKEFESSAWFPWTAVHWNIFKPSPCPCSGNSFPFVIYTHELLCSSEMQMWVIKHKVKHFCWSKLLSDRRQVMFTVNQSYHLVKYLIFRLNIKSISKIFF